MKKSKMIIISILLMVLIFIGLFIWFIAYSSTTDLSKDIRFEKYLNKSFIVKQPYALKRNSNNSNRFSDYCIDISSEEDFKNDKTILKKYKVGDTIVFTSAKRFFSNHVGNSYYLLGIENLESGETIEFEYGTSFKYSPAIWETLEEFITRRKLDRDFP